MAKLLVNNEWYYEIAPTSLYETEMENIIYQQAKQLFPLFHLIPFKKSVSSEEGSARADFILIDKFYHQWWVVEVEMSDHSLEYHVIPQIRILSRAAYGDSEIEYLVKREPDLNKKSLELLMKYTPPRILVIVNQQKPDWYLPIKYTDADLISFEVFRSDKNKHIFQLHGEIPSVPYVFISNCTFLPYLPNLLHILSPDQIQDHLTDVIKIHYLGKYSLWKVSMIKDKMFLIPKSANPLQLGLEYRLGKYNDNVFVLDEIHS